MYDLEESDLEYRTLDIVASKIGYAGIKDAMNAIGWEKHINYVAESFMIDLGICY